MFVQVKKFIGVLQMLPCHHQTIEFVSKLGDTSLHRQLSIWWLYLGELDVV